MMDSGLPASSQCISHVRVTKKIQKHFAIVRLLTCLTVMCELNDNKFNHFITYSFSSKG